VKKTSPDNLTPNLDDLRPEYAFDYSQAKRNRFAALPAETAPPKPRPKAGARKAS